jgi:hypothetical protein
MTKEKKMQAAITGVLCYLQEEQQQKAKTTKQEISQQPGNWAFYSRQLTMLNRDRMQRRVMKR